MDTKRDLPDLLDERPLNPPVLDPGFRPMGPAFLKYRRAVKDSGKGVPLRIAIERENGLVSVFATEVLPAGRSGRGGDGVLCRAHRQVPAVVAGRMEGHYPGPGGDRSPHPEDLRPGRRPRLRRRPHEPGLREAVRGRLRRSRRLPGRPGEPNPPSAATWTGAASASTSAPAISRSRPSRTGIPFSARRSPGRRARSPIPNTTTRRSARA